MGKNDETQAKPHLAVAEENHLEWRGRGLSSGMEGQRVPGELDKGLLSW